MAADILEFDTSQLPPSTPPVFHFRRGGDGSQHADGGNLRVSVIPGEGRRDGQLFDKRISYHNGVTGTRAARPKRVACLGGIRAEIGPHVVACWYRDSYVELRHGHVRRNEGTLRAGRKDEVAFVDAGEVQLSICAGHITLTRVGRPL